MSLVYSLGEQGFAYVETLVSRSILAMWLNQSLGSANMSKADFPLHQKRFPVPAYVKDSLFETLKLQLTLFMVLSFMMSVFTNTKNILHEKEFKIKVWIASCVDNMRAIPWHIVVLYITQKHVQHKKQS